ncbi:hypothetical protein ZWY2020_026113 [Hordeum vulgare]|nr:hypothetical protein ZWY2020_026113 [Hordeum vulgare]
MRCVLTGSNYRSQPLLSEPSPRWNWVTIERLRPSLHDPLTGAAQHQPLLPQSHGLWEEIYPHAVIYGDGATLVYNITSDVVGLRSTARFSAALLRPGDAEWAILERTLEYEHRFWGGSPHQPVLSCVTYHDIW